jgi:hypothetical protein
VASHRSDPLSAHRAVRGSPRGDEVFLVRVRYRSGPRPGRFCVRVVRNKTPASCCRVSRPAMDDHRLPTGSERCQPLL